MKPNNILIYDIETNGRSSIADRILEVYASKYKTVGKKLVKEKHYHSLIQIENNNVDLWAFHQNGWTEEYLNRYGNPMEQVARKFYALLDKNTIVSGFRIRTFDNQFWKRLEIRYALPSFPWDSNTFDCAIEYKCQLAKLYDRVPREDWKKAHEMILKNDYTLMIRKTGHGLKTEACCEYYGIKVNHRKQHRAEYDTNLARQILKKQRPEWF